MDFDSTKPEDVLKPEFVEQYKILHNDLWHRLVHVHTTIIILEKIEKFPFDYFYPPQENIFWSTVYSNFMYTSIAFMYALTDDHDSDTHTLPRFKNNILQDWLKDSEKQKYRDELKTAKLDKNLQDVRAKISELRHKVVAHRLFSKDGNAYLEVPKRVSLSEIRQVYDDVEKIFNSCSFRSEYVTTFYLPNYKGKPVPEDVEHLLDLIVKDSYWLNEPDFMKEFWPDRRRNRSQEEISELNEFRKKFGMSEV